MATLGEATLGTGVDQTGLEKGLKQSEQVTGGALGRMGGIFETAMGFGVAQIGMRAIGGITSAVGDMVSTVPQVDAVTATFNTLSAAIEENPLQMMGELQEATRGMVSEFDIMQAANKLISMGLADSSESAADMMEMASQLGLAMGTDATTAMEDFALMLANQSIPRLDTFGISSGAVRERILELMAETEGLSRETAFMMAVQEQGAVAMERVGEQGESGAASMAKLGATFEDMKNIMGQAFLPILMAVIEPLGEVARELAPDLKEIMGMIAEVLQDEAGPAIKDLLRSFLDVFPRIMEIVKPLIPTILRIVPIIIAIAGAALALGPLIGAFSAVAGVVGAVLPVLGMVAAFLTGPIGLAIAAVVALVAGLALAFKTNFLGIRTAVESVINFIKQIFKAFIQLVTGDFAGFKDTIVNLGRGLLDGIKNVLGNLFDVGKNLIQSLLDGIKNVWGNVTGWVEEKVGGFVDSVKDLLGIGSESKLFAGFGSGIAESLGSGFAKAMGGVEAQVGLSFQGMMGQLQPAMVGSERHDHWGLEIHSQARTEDVVSSYEMMRVMAGK